MKKRFSTPTVIVCSVIALLIGMQLNSVISGDNIYEQLRKFNDVLNLTEKYYVDNVDTPKLVESAINGLLGNLDPHSVYIPPSQLPKIQEDFQGSFEGIGVEFDVATDTLLVVAPITGGPSEALGIMAGDRIIRINDTNCLGIKQEEVFKKLRGPKGTHVKVSIFRTGEKSLIDYDIVRDKIPIYSVDTYYMVDDEVAYVSINRFSETTTSEFVQALAKLKAGGMKRLVLDLRFNPGGYLEQAVRISDEFLPRGKKIVYTKGRTPESNEDFLSSGAGRFTDLPLIILVDHGSASASEIVSGAVQDHDRGLIVGETTFGKGLVQKQYPLPDKSALRLTTARYYTPSGRLIQRPYDGKDRTAYRTEVFEKTEEEGNNIEHSSENDSGRSVFRTDGGRKVYGGGGITPDYIVKPDTATHLTRELLAKRVFFDYANMYIEEEGKALREKYGKDGRKFQKEFTVTEGMMSKFEATAKKKGLTIDRAQYEKDLTLIKTRLKADISRPIWGNEAWSLIMRSEDPQFQKAISLFPEAEKIAGLR